MSPNFSSNRPKRCSEMPGICKNIKGEITYVRQEKRNAGRCRKSEAQHKGKCSSDCQICAVLRSAGIIQIATYTLFYEACHFKEWIAYLISLVLSVLWNFTFNRKFTFKSANNVPIAMLKVAAYYCVFTPLSTWFTKYATTDLMWNNYLVEALCMVTNFVTEFLYDRFVVFRNSMNTNDVAKKDREKAEHKAQQDK